MLYLPVKGKPYWGCLIEVTSFRLPNSLMLPHWDHYYDSRSNLSGAVWWWLSWFELLDSLSQPFVQMSGTAISNWALSGWLAWVAWKVTTNRNIVYEVKLCSYWFKFLVVSLNMHCPMEQAAYYFPGYSGKSARQCSITLLRSRHLHKRLTQRI